MNPHSKPRPLIFTPRSPWGRLPLKHAHQSHMRASEDKKPGPVAAADRDIVRQPGDVAPSVKEQLQKDIEWNRKQGYASDRDLNVQQKTERDNLMRDTFPSRPAQPEANAATPKWGAAAR